jgi:hypothetical protein
MLDLEFAYGSGLGGYFAWKGCNPVVSPPFEDIKSPRVANALLLHMVREPHSLTHFITKIHHMP